MKDKKQTRTLRILSAVSIVLAVLLLCCSIPGLTSYLRGLKTVSSAADLTDGSYVQLTVNDVLGIYAETYRTNRSDTATSYIAAVQLGDGGQIFSLRLPMRVADGVQSVEQQTLAHYQSGAAAPGSDLYVKGTVAKVDTDTLGYLYSWYGTNSSWLTAAGLSSGSTDYATDLSNYVVKADYVGSYPNLWSFWIVLGAAIVFVLAAAALAVAASRLKAAPETGKSGEADGADETGAADEAGGPDETGAADEAGGPDETGAADETGGPEGVPGADGAEGAAPVDSEAGTAGTEASSDSSGGGPGGSEAESTDSGVNTGGSADDGGDGDD